MLTQYQYQLAIVGFFCSFFFDASDPPYTHNFSQFGRDGPGSVCPRSRKSRGKNGNADNHNAM